MTWGTYYHVYDAVQKSLRPDPDIAAFFNYIMTDILALVAEPSFPKPETLTPTPLPPPDFTSAYSRFPAPPVTVLDELVAAIEDTTVPPSITRPGSKPRVPKPGTPDFSYCVERCVRLHENLGHASVTKIVLAVESGRNCSGLTPGIIRACMPE